VDKREFSDAFPDFLSWINKCIKEAKEATGNLFYPGIYVYTWYYAYNVPFNLCTVLVAHNGFVFDFRILAAEVDRQNLIMQFNRADLGFADTLHQLQKVC